MIPVIVGLGIPLLLAGGYIGYLRERVSFLEEYVEAQKMVMESFGVTTCTRKEMAERIAQEAQEFLDG